MSKMFKPKVVKPEPVKEVELDQVKSRGQIGRTILGGLLKNDETKTQKKTILGG